ncbi:glutaredoxin [Truepera radiovictrix DSM 17093]|uniref:Glutaredoxin n=1 Tax=Truepera radiovictrix (strain DSM 17093 / CIP 108686 / LMG 22925 / RQ-24) TaxID=649638 RepID=D7CSA4_TRURR|nr:glutaredoxin [Truepera radiovictrix DSM 17093]
MNAPESAPPVRLYGLAGCGPCEVAKRFLSSRGVPFTFVDVAREPERRNLLEARLGSPARGVILEDGDTLEVMQGVSVAVLSRWLSAYRERHGFTPWPRRGTPSRRQRS